MLNHKQHSSPCDTHLEDTIKSTKIHGKLGIVRVHMGTKESNLHHTQGDASVSVIAKAIVLAQCLIFVKSYLLRLRKFLSVYVSNCAPPSPN